MATHSSILAWKTQWTEEPGGLQSIGSQRVRHNWSDLARLHAYVHYFFPSRCEWHLRFLKAKCHHKGFILSSSKTTTSAKRFPNVWPFEFVLEAWHLLSHFSQALPDPRLSHRQLSYPVSSFEKWDNHWENEKEILGPSQFWCSLSVTSLWGLTAKD